MPTQDFTVAGADSFTKLDGITEITVELIAGAASGGSTEGAGTANSGGGGGGAGARSVLTVPSAETVYDLQVGAGGAAQTGNNVDGNPGTASWFDTPSTVYADPGLGTGNRAADGLGGPGGLAANSIGDTVVDGGDGQPPQSDRGGAGGDGASIGSLVGGTGAPEQTTANSNGHPGSAPGGGGGGAQDNSSLGRFNGGPGADGIVRVSWEDPPPPSGSAETDNTWLPDATGDTAGATGEADTTNTWTLSAEGTTPPGPPPIGPCAPWPVPAPGDCVAGCTIPDGTDPTIIERAAHQATAIMQRLSGGRVGHCTETIRPLGECPTCRRTPCCGAGDRVRLHSARGPVTDVVGVTIGGTPVTDWRFWPSTATLHRAPPARWPVRDQRWLDCDDPGVLCVEVTIGSAPDTYDLMVFNELVCELVRACLPDCDCRVPQGADDATILFGIPALQQWADLHKTPRRVHSPDLHPTDSGGGCGC